MKYGALPSERSGEAITALVVGFSIVYGILLGIPKVLNSLFNWNIDLGFGLDIFSYWVLIVAGAISFSLDFYLEKNMEYRKKRKERIVCCYYDRFQKKNRCIEVEK